MRAAEPTTKTASCSIERRDCPRSCLAWKQSPLVGHYLLTLETPPRTHIHLHVVGQLSRKLRQFAVDIAVLAGFGRAAQREDQPVLSTVFPVAVRIGGAIGRGQVQTAAKIMVVAGLGKIAAFSRLA